MADLHLQALLQGTWRDIALLEFPKPELGTEGSCNFDYEPDHLAEWLAANDPLAAASLTLPLAFAPTCLRRWPAFLDDIRPLGSARQWWLRRLGLPDGAAADFRLLQEGVIAPIGHLRIRESLPPRTAKTRRFRRRDVVDREHAFLDYAAEQGVQVGGATGAGGASPKILVRRDARGGVWIDTWQDERSPDRHYLVKFARGERTRRDCDVLRAEYYYYLALARLGVDTVAVDGLELHEGRHGPSLWLPRFDVTRIRGRETRLGVESMYALLGAPPGAFLKHQDVLARLHEVLAPAPRREVTLEYLRRDLLNLVFGNSDNHGRNTSVLKSSRGVRLAPVYDFAPMVMDPEGITRTTRWEQFERGGDVDWPGLLASFGADEPHLRSGLKKLANALVGLPALLRRLGLPKAILTYAPLGLGHTKEALRQWTLL